MRGERFSVPVSDVETKRVPESASVVDSQPSLVEAPVSSQLAPERDYSSPTTEVTHPDEPIVDLVPVSNHEDISAALTEVPKTMDEIVRLQETLNEQMNIVEQG